jgi:hypothetical protein
LVRSPDFFEQLNTEFRFTFDVCARAANTQGARYFFIVEDDGVSQV